MDPTTLPTFQNLPTYLRKPFLRAVNQNPLAWLLQPTTDEVFNSSNRCWARLQAFAFSLGFTVVTGKVYSSRTPRWQFRCIHHSIKSQNNRRLEPEMEKNTKGIIVITRKRNGTV